MFQVFASFCIGQISLQQGLMTTLYSTCTKLLSTITITNTNEYYQSTTTISNSLDCLVLQVHALLLSIATTTDYYYYSPGFANWTSKFYSSFSQLRIQLAIPLCQEG